MKLFAVSQRNNGRRPLRGVLQEREREVVLLQRQQLQGSSSYLLPKYLLHLLIPSLFVCWLLQEVAEDQIETSSAYMLFYERVGLDGEAYLPRLDPRATPQVTEDELEAEENDLRKICTAF